MVKVISPIVAGGNVLFAVRFIAGTLGTLVTGVERPLPPPPLRYLEGGVLGQGGSSGVHGKGAGMVLGGSGKGGFFQGQGGVGAAMGGVRVVAPTGRDQSYTPQGEPTFRKGAGAKGGGKGGGIPGAGVGSGNRVRFGGFQEAAGGSGDAREGLLVLFFHRGTRHLMR